MTVKAWLEGHQFDLEALAELLPTGNTRVIRQGDRYYLTSTEIDNRSPDVKFYEVAPTVLQRVNGLALARDARYRPVRLSGRYQDGERGHTVVQVGTAEERSKAMPVAVVINGEQVATAPLTAPDHLLLADSNADVAEALQIMGQPEPLNWVELYRVLEIIEHSGRLRTAIDAADISNKQVTRFNRTACHPEAAGPDARHARSKQEPPRPPMSITDARQLISDMVRGWLESFQQ
jgi:hypothetical protein